MEYRYFRPVSPDRYSQLWVSDFKVANPLTTLQKYRAIFSADSIIQNCKGVINQLDTSIAKLEKKPTKEHHE